jgi:hypothetical protein
MREPITAEQANSMNDMANSIATSLMEPSDPNIAMTVLGMVCAKMIFACTQNRKDFDETCHILGRQIQAMADSGEADGVIRWEKAD